MTVYAEGFEAHRMDQLHPCPKDIISMRNQSRQSAMLLLKCSKQTHEIFRREMKTSLLEGADHCKLEYFPFTLPLD